MLGAMIGTKINIFNDTKGLGGKDGTAIYQPEAVTFLNNATDFLYIPSISCVDNGAFSFSGWMKAQTYRIPVLTANPLTDYDTSLSWGGSQLASISMYLQNRIITNQFSTRQSYNTPLGCWNHFLISMETTPVKRGQILVNGISVTSTSDGLLSSVFTPTINGSLFTIGSDTFGPGASGNVFQAADFWIAPGVSLLDSNGQIPQATREKFITAVGQRPVYLGANGELPTGSAPAVFLMGNASTFPVNRGTGGAITVTGSITTTIGPTIALTPYHPPAVLVSTDSGYSLVASCVDSGFISGSGWYKGSSGGSGLQNNIFWVVDPNNNYYPWFGYDTNTQYRIEADGPGPVDVLRQNFDKPVVDVWHHYIFTIDTGKATAQKTIKMYIDEVLVTSTLVQFGGGAFTASVNGLSVMFCGDFVFGGSDPHSEAEVWVAVGQSLLNASGEIPISTIRKFRNADGTPVYLGQAGELPTGTPPTFYLGGPPMAANITGFSAFNRNRGIGSTIATLTSAGGIVATAGP